MPRSKGKLGLRKEIRINRYVKERMEELLNTGDFSSEADLIRTAIITLYKDYECNGRLRNIKRELT
jgi:Arc/MetJ-type ribon-helix-helix transcriptional regulator